MAIFELPGSLTQLLLGEWDHLRKGLPAQAATGLAALAFRDQRILSDP